MDRKAINCLFGFKIKHGVCVPDLPTLVLGPLPAILIATLPPFPVKILKEGEIDFYHRYLKEIRCVSALVGIFMVFPEDFDSGMKLLNYFKARNVSCMGIEQVKITESGYYLLKNLLPLNISDIQLYLTIQ